MGRKKYTADERVRMVSMFIEKTREIIETEGIDQVTIRKIARLCGYNSATLYHYFRDVDELITLSCMSYLEDYCRSWAEELRVERSSYETYLLTWALFCRYAFAQPHIFQRIFFYPHSWPLGEIIRSYYDLFPEQLENISGAVYGMLTGGSLVERELFVLEPLADEGLVRPEDVMMIAVMAVYHFSSLLEEKCRSGDAADNAQLTESQVSAVRFLVGKK